uniref:RAB3GAP2_N domain-containing protein n=1 Tax=Syphacia muris TaxID=451379 RepID=A0A0N5AXC0_9BILA
MEKILVECGRLEEEQMLLLDNFFSSSSIHEKCNAGIEGEDINADEDDEEDDNEDSFEKEAGVINWADESVRICIKQLLLTFYFTLGKGDIIVIALAQKIAVLENNRLSDPVYEIIGQFSVVACDQSYNSVYIRSMCVIPLAVTRTTETKDYDFIAIVVGLSNGYVHFYTERGVLLRSEMFSENPIDNVRFGKSVLPGEQELVVLAVDRMTIVDGLSLHVALKTAKIQIARGEDDIHKIATKALLNVEKIKLAQKIAITDLAVLGPYEQQYVETYAAASVSPAGSKACITSLTPPIYTTYMFTGKSPYVAFGWNRFGEAPSNLISEIVYNYGAELVSNVVSSLPKFGFGLFSGPKGDNSAQTQRNRTTENRALASRISTRLEMRSIFEDDGREGERLFPAPYGSPFVAVTDSIARVILFDTSMRQIRRVWKGYRDARCAWIESTTTVDTKRKSEIHSETAKKKTLLLVLFAPRRGLLEAWLPLNGKRIAAVNVEKNGRLISSFKARDYTLGNLTLVEDSTASAFFLSSNGKFYKIEIPFYLTLLHESTATIHDENVLNEIRQLNNDAFFNQLQLDQLTNLICTLKIPSILRETLDLILKKRSITVVQYQQILTALSKHLDFEVCRKPTADILSFRKYVNFVTHLSNIYLYLQNCHRMADGKWLTVSSKDTVDTSLLISEIVNNETLRNKFRLNADLFKTCLEQIISCGEEFEEMKFSDFSFADFLGSFDFSMLTSLKHSNSEPPNKTHSHVASTFSLCLVARAIDFSEHGCKETEMKKVENEGVIGFNSNTERGWEKVEYSLEKWDFLIKNLLCMSTLKRLPHSPEISLQEFADSGKAYYREKLGLWTSIYKPDILIFNEVVTSEQSDIPLQNDECWVKALKEFLQFFPFSMKAEFILCDCAWECVNSWKRSVDKNVEELQYAMKFISLLCNMPYLQQTICCLLWETHLKEPLKALFEWLNKAGKSPKERHARKQIGLCENQLSDFVNCCIDVLRILQANTDSLHSMSLNVFYEDFIEAFFGFYERGRKAKREALLSVLSRQTLPVYDLVVHHFDLACVIELQLALSMRLHPADLFDDELALEAFFVPLCRQKTVPTSDVVASLRRKRQNFLERCTALITENHRSSTVLYELVDCLVHDWALDVDGITLKQMEGLLVLGEQDDVLRCMYRVRFPELVLERCYPYLLARLRFYMKEYCPDLIGIAKRQGQWPKWAQTALQTSCGENIKLVRVPTIKEIEDFVSVLQDFSNKIQNSTDTLLIKIRVLNDIAKILKLVSD